jgi:DNA-binding transcriptional MerR regulator
MRSQDVARLAGVSVRTLRHYHQIGVLPEPVRQSNGYRSYDLATVARLLRIRLLTELGVPLGKVEEMLDTTPRQDLLDEIDSRLASEIERLTSDVGRSLAFAERDSAPTSRRTWPSSSLSGPWNGPGGCSASSTRTRCWCSPASWARSP